MRGCRSIRTISCVVTIASNVHGSVHRHNILIYRVSINSFPDYKHFLQENYEEYKRSTCWSVLTCCKKLLDLNYILKNIYICIPGSFLVITFCNQGKNLCSPCIYIYIYIHTHTHTHMCVCVCGWINRKKSPILYINSISWFNWNALKWSLQEQNELWSTRENGSGGNKDPAPAGLRRR